MQINRAAGGGYGGGVNGRDEFNGGIFWVDSIVECIKSVGVVCARTAVKEIFVAYLNVCD